MDTPNSWRVVCQDPGDGSGDVIVELPSELLAELGWTLGDELKVERSKEEISLMLKPRSVRPDEVRRAVCPATRHSNGYERSADQFPKR